MAYGFHTTDGTSVADYIASTLASDAVARSWALRAYTRSGGGTANNNGRLFDQTNCHLIAGGTAGDRVVFGSLWSGTEGGWAWFIPKNQWNSLVLTYNGSATSNDPILYVNSGSPAAFASPGATDVNPTGTRNTSAGPLYIGNRQTPLDRAHDGMIAEVAVWDRILSSTEAGDFAAGKSPLSMATDLVEYLLLINPARSLVRSAPTVSGAVAQTHPRIITGTAVGSISESDVVAGGKTLVITCADTTWIAP